MVSGATAAGVAAIWNSSETEQGIVLLQSGQKPLWSVKCIQDQIKAKTDTQDSESLLKQSSVITTPSVTHPRCLPRRSLIETGEESAARLEETCKIKHWSLPAVVYSIHNYHSYTYTYTYSIASTSSFAPCRMSHRSRASRWKWKRYVIVALAVATPSDTISMSK